MVTIRRSLNRFALVAMSLSLVSLVTAEPSRAADPNAAARQAQIDAEMAGNQAAETERRMREQAAVDGADAVDLNAEGAEVDNLERQERQDRVREREAERDADMDNGGE